MQEPAPRVADRLGKLSGSLVFGATVFLLCLIGIFSRPGADLASFWPANAFMLGMLIRFPRLATPASWLACAAGFALADLLTGSTLLKTVALNLGNLAAIAVGFVALSRFGLSELRMASPTSALLMLVGIAAAALTAGVIGVVLDPLLFGGRPIDALFFWSATELVNYVAFLPMILTLPDHPIQSLAAAMEKRLHLLDFAPLLTLLLTVLLGIWIGGPGAIAFPVLALLWCALAYSLFVTAFLTFLTVSWTLVAINFGYLDVVSSSSDRVTLLSIRTAVSLIGIGPLVVSSVMAAREELLQRFQFLSRHDQMTGLLNRASFIADAQRSLTSGRTGVSQSAVLMLDLDHFKQINDAFGHAGGDLVLTEFAEIIRKNLRKSDIAGRMGGEEFAILLADCSEAEALEIAARINQVLAGGEVRLPDGRLITATVSIGMTVTASAHTDLDRMLAAADAALYEAKRSGRDRVSLRPVIG